MTLPSALRVAAIVGAAVLVGAPKPPPSSPAFVPAIGYKYSSGNYSDLRLSNADGTAAVRLVRAPFGGLGMFDLAPAAQRQAAYILHGSPTTLRFVNWEQSTPEGPLTVALDPVPVYTHPSIFDVEFSPDGNQVAFVSHDPTEGGRLHVHYVATKQEVRPPVTLPNPVLQIAWRESDGAILLGGSQTLHIYSNNQVTPAWSLSMLRDLDVQRMGGGRVLASFTQNDRTLIYFWDGAVAAGAPLLTPTGITGWRGHYNCDNSRILYHVQIKQPYSTYIVDASNPSGPRQTFSTDSNLAFAEFLPTCS